jgi:transcription-repair coupling factor (superfamily II helicase)
MVSVTDRCFINNRIENIKEIAGMIQRLVPNARVGIGHGQMEGTRGIDAEF